MDCEYCNYCAKNLIFEEKKIWKISQLGIEPGTLWLWALSQDQYTKRSCINYEQRRMLYQVLQENQSSGNFKRSNFQKFEVGQQSHMTSRESKLFWYVFRVFQGICDEFFFCFWRFLFSREAKLPHLLVIPSYP